MCGKFKETMGESLLSMFYVGIEMKEIYVISTMCLDILSLFHLVCVSYGVESVERLN